MNSHLPAVAARDQARKSFPQRQITTTCRLTLTLRKGLSSGAKRGPYWEAERANDLTVIRLCQRFADNGGKSATAISICAVADLTLVYVFFGGGVCVFCLGVCLVG